MANELVERKAGDLSLEPCRREKAAELAAILLGSYPKHSVDEPAIYTRAMVSLLEQYPADIGAKAVDHVTKTCRYLPTRADLYAALEERMTERRGFLFREMARREEEERRAKERAEAEENDRLRRDFLKRHNGKTPLEVLRERGLWGGSDSEEEDKNETDSNQTEA